MQEIGPKVGGAWALSLKGGCSFVRRLLFARQSQLCSLSHGTRDADGYSCALEPEHNQPFCCSLAILISYELLSLEA